MKKLLTFSFIFGVFVFSCKKQDIQQAKELGLSITNEGNQFKDLKVPGSANFSLTTSGSKKLAAVKAAASDNSGCVSVLHTQSQNFDKLNVIDPTSDILYVGSLLDGNSIQTGAYSPLILSSDYVRKPITFSVSIDGSSGPISKTIIPELSSYRNAMQEIINGPVVGQQPAAFTFEVRKVRSRKEITMIASANMGIGKFFSSTVNYDENNINNKNYYLLKIYQKFFTADIDIPQDGNLFNKPIDYSSDVAPVYVSSIDYGRSAYLLIESSYDSTRVRKALTVTFDFWKVKGGGGISQETKDVTDEMTISGTAIGGSSSLAAETINGLESFHDYVTKSGNLTPDSRGAIIAYRLRNAKNHGIYNTLINGDYYTRDCSGAKRLLYDFYSKQFGHRYTINSNYANEHAGWIRIVNDPIYVYGSQVAGSVPVYIMQDRVRAIYCLTTDNTVNLDIWATTGQPDFYAYKTQFTGTVPIHQFYNPSYYSHGLFYDITYNPLANGWVENGIKFYAFNSPN
ncbi:thiol-activated cytolysin family protein [Pedobacter nutrimenti]|uniref:thiol-activated cytolysin family protein n=1 Tax=Pedobacter nutrimenti TaxID=1241337 RepID=UPI00292CAE4E|nr:thiol-activated cytolysin family protein [Pedobacter nutrimenti]